MLRLLAALVLLRVLGQVVSVQLLLGHELVLQLCG